jgi:prepilin-type N-terminal cleavage/methylation domain-containing protein
MNPLRQSMDPFPVAARGRTPRRSRRQGGFRRRLRAIRNPQSAIRNPQSRRGMTLIEMIAALGIAAVFLTMLAFHVVTLANIWLNRTDDDFFDQHVEGVTLFLQRQLDDATVTEGTSSPILWERPPGWSEARDPLLHFGLPEAPALFVREGARLPEVRVWIHFEERNGLCLLWYPMLLAEPPEYLDEVYNTRVSSFVSRIDYAYYDREEDRWEDSDRPRETVDGQRILPHALRLHFVHDDETRARMLYIPQAIPDVPTF